MEDTRIKLTDGSGRWFNLDLADKYGLEKDALKELYRTKNGAFILRRLEVAGKAEEYVLISVEKAHSLLAGVGDVYFKELEI